MPVCFSLIDRHVYVIIESWIRLNASAAALGATDLERLARSSAGPEYLRYSPGYRRYRLRDRGTLHTGEAWLAAQIVSSAEYLLGWLRGKPQENFS